jgi:hypothetical protein
MPTQRGGIQCGGGFDLFSGPEKIQSALSLELDSVSVVSTAVNQIRAIRSGGEGTIEALNILQESNRR